MTKVEEAQDILKSLGLPSSQQNEISALTLLALCGIGNDMHGKRLIDTELRFQKVSCYLLKKNIENNMRRILVRPFGDKFFINLYKHE